MKLPSFSRRDLQRFEAMRGRIRAPADLRPVLRSVTNVLVLAPHPDDEIVGCGGSLIYHRSLGQTIACCYLTDGSRGDASTPGPRSQVAETRRREARQVAQELGWSATEFWEYPDGDLPLDESSVNRLSRLLHRVEPDLIYVPAPWESHPDHYRAFEILVHVMAGERHALTGRESGRNRRYIHLYSVWSEGLVNACLNITDYWPLKTRLLALYQSQRGFGIQQLASLSNRLTAVRNPFSSMLYGEAFYRLGDDRLGGFFNAVRRIYPSCWP
jgi:LmbE family N-acetylglucosaminyl deacetylase